MLGFLRKLSTAGDGDPFRSARSATAWLRELPCEDVLERQRHVLRAFDAAQRASVSMDRERIAAIELLDAAFDHDRRRLIAQYIERVERGATTSEQLWQGAYELNRRFVYAYQAALDRALTTVETLRWRSLVPLLAARLIHCHGIDTKLRAFRYQRAIPANWLALHGLYRRCVALNLQHAPLIGASGSDERRMTVEEEYLYVLLLDRIDTGSMSPQDFYFASRALRGWCSELTLVAAPGGRGSLVVDIDGRTGFGRPEKAAHPTLRYFDTAPLKAKLASAIGFVAVGVAGEKTELGAEVRSAVLRKMSLALDTSTRSERSRCGRSAVNAAATLRVGLMAICRGLVGDGPYQHRANVSRLDPQAGLFSFDAGGDDTLDAQLDCVVVDRSATGVRLRISGACAHGITVGALVAVRPSDTVAWTLGIVRRVRTLPSERVEAGVSTLDGFGLFAILQTSSANSPELQAFVDGPDTMSHGDTFGGVYLAQSATTPASEPDGVLFLPAAHYWMGRKAFLNAGNFAQPVALGERVEQNGDWVQAAIQCPRRAAAPLLHAAVGDTDRGGSRDRRPAEARPQAVRRLMRPDQKPYTGSPP